MAIISRKEDKTDHLFIYIPNIRLSAVREDLIAVCYEFEVVFWMNFDDILLRLEIKRVVRFLMLAATSLLSVQRSLNCGEIGTVLEGSLDSDHFIILLVEFTIKATIDLYFADLVVFKVFSLVFNEFAMFYHIFRFVAMRAPHQHTVDFIAEILLTQPVVLGDVILKSLARIDHWIYCSLRLFVH